MGMAKRYPLAFHPFAMLRMIKKDQYCFDEIYWLSTVIGLGVVRNRRSASSATNLDAMNGEIDLSFSPTSDEDSDPIEEDVTDPDVPGSLSMSPIMD